MGFIQPCYIYKNTESLRENLEKLGYKCNCKFDSNMLWIVGNNYFCSNQMLLNNREIGDLVFDKICCGTNEELFLAIAALRDDSDINQWFVLETNLATINNPEIIKLNYGSFIKCKRDSWFIDLDDNGNPSTISSRNIPAHKASIDELITYFKQ